MNAFKQVFPVFAMVMTPVLLAIMLGAYLIVLTLWDTINARIEIKRAVKQYRPLAE